MTTFGEKLKAARESRGIELPDVSAATNVGVHLLEALEANDFKRLPGGPFNKGFVRAYARHIGIDPEEAVDAYARQERALGIRTPDVEREMPRHETRMLEFRNDGDQTTLVLDWTMVKRALMGAGALILLLAATWVLWPTGDPPAAPAEASTPAPMEEMSPAGMDQPVDAVDDSARQAEVTAQPAAVPPPADPQPAPAAVDEGEDPAPSAGGETEDPSPPTATAVQATDSPLNVMDFGTGTGVSQRQLVGRSESFPVGTQVWFWTRTVGGEKDDLLQHVWLREGRQVISYERTLGGPHWRNSSRKTLTAGSEGSWTVEARDAQGRVVARASFTCTGE